MLDRALQEKCLKELIELREHILTHSPKVSNEVKNYKSLTNMYHYVSMRCLDITNLQDNLTKLGLSSLGRSQSHVMDTIEKAITILSNSLTKDTALVENDFVTFDEAQELLLKNSELFGENKNHEFQTKIMITLPSEASTNKTLIEDLAKSGVNLFRINTAHDNPNAWSAMAETIKEINSNNKDKIKIYVDLAGPKIRTGKIKRVKSPIKIGNKKAELKYLNLVSEEYSTKPEDTDATGEKIPATIAVHEEFLTHARESDFIEIVDINSKKRFIKVERVYKNICECSIEKRVIIDENSRITIYKDKKKYTAHPKNIIEVPEEIRVFEDDEIIITDEDIIGQFDYEDDNGNYSAIINCSDRDVLSHVKVNDEVFIDDGKIELIVTKKLSDSKVVAKVINAKENGVVIKEEKGINFPTSNLMLDAITDEDRDNLKTVVEFANIIGISFAQTKGDIEALKDELKKYKKELAIVAKIETKLAIENLPEILSALSDIDSGIMIARGDLAIEVGFENLAYIQEEIFDLCASSHTPVIYATQILENKMKTNLPSRAEITDAAFGQRADCIMLNKGAFAIDTIKILTHILDKMHTIYKKNKQLLTVCREWRF